MSARPGSATIFRRPLWRRVSFAVGGCAVGPLALLSGPGENLFQTLLGWVALFAAPALGIRCAYLRVEAGEDVRFVNWTRTVVLEWEDIERFVYVGDLCAQVRGGEPVIASAFSTGYARVTLTGAHGRRVVRELESLRRSREVGARDTSE